MSFANDVKNDLLNGGAIDNVALKLEIEAMLRLGSEIVISKPLKLVFSSANLSTVTYLIKQMKKMYNFEYEIEQRKIERFNNDTSYSAIIYNANGIIDDLKLSSLESDYRVNVFDDENYVASYLKGSFLVRGSVNDPKKKNSHFEISSSNQNEIIFIQKLINSFDLNARITKRKHYYVTYIKSQEAIGDLLYRLGAKATMNYYQDVLITKEIATNAKRTINLDIANQDKTNSASKDQLKYIKYIEYNMDLAFIDQKLLMVMKVRKDYPEHSLSQLLDVIHDEYDDKLTKSGLNHRLRKLKEIALEHMNSNKLK